MHLSYFSQKVEHSKNTIEEDDVLEEDDSEGYYPYVFGPIEEEETLSKKVEKGQPDSVVPSKTKRRGKHSAARKANQ